MYAFYALVIKIFWLYMSDIDIIVDVVQLHVCHGDVSILQCPARTTIPVLDRNWFFQMWTSVTRASTSV